MKDIQVLMEKISEWSDKTFDGGQFNQKRCVPISYHLQKETKELTEALEAFMDDPSTENCDAANMEFADVFLLFLDCLNHYGLLAKTLKNVSLEKMKINDARQWGEPDENGVVEHIKSNSKGGQK